MILPDTNLLLYAYDTASPFHSRSAAWWSKSLSGSEPVALCPAVLFGFLRISTSPRVFLHPITVHQAADHIADWLDQPIAQFVDMEAGDVQSALTLMVESGGTGNLSTDAQIAAIALRLGAVIHSADAHFDLFQGVRWLNPLKSRSKP